MGTVRAARDAVPAPCRPTAARPQGSPQGNKLSTDPLRLTTGESPAEPGVSTRWQQVAHSLSTGRVHRSVDTRIIRTETDPGLASLNGRLGLGPDLLFVNAGSELDEDEPVGGDVEDTQVGDDPLDAAPTGVGERAFVLHF